MQTANTSLPPSFSQQTRYLSHYLRNTFKKIRSSRNANSKKKFNAVSKIPPRMVHSKPIRTFSRQPPTPISARSAKKSSIITTTISTSNCIEPGQKTQTQPFSYSNFARISNSKLKKSNEGAKPRVFAKIARNRRRASLQKK